MFKRYIKEYILKNKYDLTVLLIILIIGILVGSGIYIFSDASVKEELAHKATEVFKLASSKEYIETNIVANGIKTNVILLVILATSSVTLFGRYVIEMMMLLKGAMLSIYSFVLFSVFGLGYGTLVVVLLVVLVNLIYIPAYIFLSLLFMEIHFNTFKTKQSAMNSLELVGNTIKILIGLVLIFSSVILEQMASLAALKVFLKLN